ncbi:MAG: ABC transporter permease [Chloroflexi bacterium]|nr:ABC transporter permease [Chloroflexota bacterium]
MAAEQGIIEQPGTIGAPRSLSDRPLIARSGIQFWRFMIHKPLGGAGVIVILVVLVMALFPYQLDRYDPEQIFSKVNPSYDPAIAAQAETDPTIKLKYRPEVFQKGEVPLNAAGPSSGHWLGTDGLGRDLYSRIIHGARTAVIVGLGASLIAMFLGVTIGISSAYFGGMVDFLVQRVVDTFQAFPALIILILFNQVVASPTVKVNTISLGIVGFATVVRIVRSSVLAAREEVYITAARTVGANDLRIMARHIFPNITAPIIVIFTSSIGLYILAEATLSYLGLGDPTAFSWGKMVEEGRRVGPSSPLMALFVGSALTLTVLAFSLAGDALRDVLDPRLRGRGGRAGF